MKPTKDIRHCPLYGGRYYADVLGNIYLDPEGEQKVGVYVNNTTGHVITTPHPQAPVHRIVYYAFNPDAPVDGYDIHHISEIKTKNHLNNKYSTRRTISLWT